MSVSLKSFHKQNTYTPPKVICWKKRTTLVPKLFVEKKEPQVITMSNSLMSISFKIN